MFAVIPLVFTASWASGINPYLLVTLTCLLGRADWVSVPAAFLRTDVLIAAIVLTVIDMIVDKVALLDSAWDAANTIVRPIAGAVVAVLLADPTTPLLTAAVAATGGAIALITHIAKATTRLAVNTSPEPVSNILVSFFEDLLVAGVVLLAIVSPWLAGGIALVALCLSVTAAVIAVRVLRKAGKHGWSFLQRKKAETQIAAIAP